MKKTIILTALTVLVFGTPMRAAASEAPPEIMISEVDWAGSPRSTADEWLELQNLEEEAIDLSGWSIEGAATGNGTLTLPSGAIIEAGGVYLIANYAATNSTLGIEPGYVTTSVALSNSALHLVLRDPAGTEVDTAGDGGAPEAGTSGSVGYASMIRVDEGWITATTSINFDEGVVQYGTPGVADISQATESPQTTEEDVQTVEAEEETPAEQTDAQGTTEPVSTETDQSSSAVESPDSSGSTAPETTEEAAPTSETVSDESVAEVTSEESTTATPEQEEPTTIRYENGTLLINEVVSNPSEGNEWVEVSNPGEETIDLTGWSVAEAGGTSQALTGEIVSNEFAVVEFRSRLNNSGDHLELLDPTGNIIDQVSYGDESEENPAPGKGSSLARTSDGVFAVTDTLTRGAENVFPTSEETAEEETVTEESQQSEEEAEPEQETTASCTEGDTLALIALLPNPEGSDEEGEYIRLQNTGQETLCLGGWVVRDLSTSYDLEGELAGGGTLVLSRTETHIALNNTTPETVELVAPTGEVVDTVSYDQAEENALYTQVDGAWQWTDVSTTTEPEDVPETESQTGTGSSEDDTPGAQSVSTSGKSLETVFGVVIAEPGTFGSQIMYLDGRQVYQYQGDFPALEIGDVVRAVGGFSTSHGETRLKVSGAGSIRVIDSAVVEPIDAELTELNDLTARLIRVTGQVTRRSGDRLTITAGEAELLVIAKSPTGISFSSVEVGTTLQITGVLTSYDGTMRLLPRTMEDIVVVTNPLEESAQTPTRDRAPQRALGLSLVGATSTAVGARAWWWRRKKKLV